MAELLNVLFFFQARSHLDQPSPHQEDKAVAINYPDVSFFTLLNTVQKGMSPCRTNCPEKLQ